MTDETVRSCSKSSEALLGVSSRFLAEVDLPSADIRSALCEMCMEIHLSMDAMCDKFFQALRRRVYTTPKSYLDLIKLYVEILGQRRKVCLPRFSF